MCLCAHAILGGSGALELPGGRASRCIASTAVRIVPIPIGREEETSPRLVDRHDVLNGLGLNEKTVVDHDIHGVGLILEQKETKETKGIGKVVHAQPVRSPRESDSTHLSRAATNIKIVMECQVKVED